MLGFITNNSYLSGVTHHGMRQKLLESFDKIYILNLHGSSRTRENPPGKLKDENVFDIQQGVAIAVYVKLEKPLKEKKVYYADLWGLRSEKYKYLFENDVESTDWQELEPRESYYFFVPKDFALQEEYDKFWKVTDIFKERGSGIITRRDTLTVAFKRDELENRMPMFTNLNLPDSVITETFKITDTTEWNLHTAREKVKSEKLQELIKKYHYRPFDFRYIYYSDSVVSRTCRKWMKHLLSENLALLTTRVITDVEEKGSFVSKGDWGYSHYFWTELFLPTLPLP